MNEDLVNTPLTEEKLSKLGLEITDLKASPLHYIDPAWDYAKTFKLLVYFQSRLESTISYISSKETATPEANTELVNRLDQLMLYLRSIQEKLK